MKATFGGHANVDKGNDLGKDPIVKNSSFNNSSRVDRLAGSFCSILAIKFLAVLLIEQD